MSQTENDQMAAPVKQDGPTNDVTKVYDQKAGTYVQQQPTPPAPGQQQISPFGAMRKGG